MRYETDTGIGYFEDAEGRVVDRVTVEPGEHEAGDPRETFVECDSIDDCPPVDDHYQPDPPDLSTDIDRKAAFLEAGGDAITARDGMDANADIPPEVVDLADAVMRMNYLIYVHLAGDANRVDSFEDRFFTD